MTHRATLCILLRARTAYRSRRRAGTSRSTAAWAHLWHVRGLADIRQHHRHHQRPPQRTRSPASGLPQPYVSHRHAAQQLTSADSAFLYQFAGPAGVFNDVTIGKNVGFVCNDTAVAFNAQKGWDPVTGACFSVQALEVFSTSMQASAPRTTPSCCLRRTTTAGSDCTTCKVSCASYLRR
jgi:hypothetical protein